MPLSTVPVVKKCSDCAEEVRAEARKCRFCGFIFSESSDAERRPELPHAEQLALDAAPAQLAAAPLKRKTSPVIWILACVGGLVVLFALLLVAGGTLATIALPRVNKARIYSQEVGAIAAIRTLHTEQVMYYSQYGRYAVSLTELGPPASGAASPAAADVIDKELASGLKGGYEFTLVGNRDGYVINADPEMLNGSGSRTFYSNQDMVIHTNHAPQRATATSPELTRANDEGR
jgi:type IV pilus assembly protein PilA